MHKRFIFYCFLFGFTCLQAQRLFIPKDSVVVVENGKTLRNPFAGGLNFVQISTVDLDGDGQEDLVTFDRMGDRLKTFIYQPTSKTYIYTPAFETGFPPDLRFWVFLEDYNCDGKKDLFTGVNGGIRLYQNDSPPSGPLHFTIKDSLIASEYNGFRTSLYVSPLNLPALSDIDNDGDLDILTFDLSGSFVEFHQNLSKENYGSCDSLVFRWDSKNSHGCWGNFDATGNINSVQLHQGCRGNHREMKVSHHSGSALALYDEDGDGDKEILISCICANNLLYLHNGGNPQLADMDAQDSIFPKNSVAVNLISFPGSFFADVDHDGKKDLLVSPNLSDKAENNNSVWLYKNTGASNAVFTLQQRNFLQEDMIDVGQGANPVLFDYDSDGDLDLVIGNYGVFNGNYISSLRLYKNEKINGKITFTLENADFAGVSTLKLINLHPAFGDLDGDGDLDMIIGESTGSLYYFNNSAGKGNVASFQLSAPLYKGIDVGQYSAPQLVDVDKDGLLDLIIGKESGKISYYHNTGTSSDPQFTLVTTDFGKVSVVISPNISGYSTPLLFQNNGLWALLVGSESGNLYLYGNIDGNLDGAFNRIRSYKTDVPEKGNISIDLGDLDKDGKTDLVVGTAQGGIMLFDASGAFSLVSALNSLPKILSAQIYPNPANDAINISLYSYTQQNMEVSVFDVLGRCVIQHSFSSDKGSLSTTQLPNGIYVCRISNQEGMTTVNFVIQHTFR